MPNLVSWEFTLESVACKLPRWPVNFQGVAGKFPKKILKVFPNFEISFDTITLRQQVCMIQEQKYFSLKTFDQGQIIEKIYIEIKLILNPGAPTIYH